MMPSMPPPGLPLFLFLLFLLLRAGPLLGDPLAPPPPPPPAAVCGPDGCYALFLERRTFLEAWRGCRELGGNLATLQRPEEAAQVAELLRSAAVGGAVRGAVAGAVGAWGGGGGGDRAPTAPRRLFWIGLRRPARHCHPGRPLRGFAWTTGEPDGAYSNWARAAAAAGSSGCSAPRCAGLDGGDARWLDGSCTAPADGYLCRFASRGMCPALGDGAAGAVRYTTPFGPVAGHLLRRVPFGTVAAVACPGGGGAVSVLCLQTEEEEEEEEGGGGPLSVGWSKEPPLCPREEEEEEEEEEEAATAAYPHSWCEGDNGGCQQLCLDLDDGSGYACECHAGYYLLPDGHSCAAAHNACRDRPCQFGCVPVEEEEEEGGGGLPAGYRCQCPPGYELAPDGHRCHDVDECAEAAPCEHRCENTDGSYVCRCHLGFSPSEDEPGQCADTDECQFPGVCQQMCVNYVGGFECYCTEGYELDADGISCLLVAQLPPPLATAESHRRAGHLPPYQSGHGWPLRQDLDHQHQHHHPGDGSALADHFPVFQDIRVGSPEFESPSSFIPDPRVVPRMVADTQPPTVSPDPQDSGRLWVPHSPAFLDLTETPGPTSAATTSPSPPGGRSSPLTLTPALRDLPGPPSGPREAQTPDVPSPPTTTRPVPPPQLLTSSPYRSGSGAAVWGVRAPPAPAFTTPSPVLGGEDGQEQKSDGRWLLVALLVPLCVFLVVMLALGIVYCTRCGPQAKARSVTHCYRWVISSAGKGAAPPPGPCQTATCRTSV